VKKTAIAAISAILLISLSACGSSPSSSKGDASEAWFTGDGGKGKSLAILAPRATGLAENQNYIPSLVQGEFVSNFTGFSAISVLDRQRLDEQYGELLSGYYSDNAQEGLDLGHLSPTDYIMGGSITRTATGYAMQIGITKSADKMTVASYSGTFTFAELDNLSGVRRASLDLLQKMGVASTEQAKTELAGAAASTHVNAQTSLARGITAQQQGTEVAALSYFFQAAAFDPSLAEAASRSSTMSANISSGNIGEDARNDIAWRRAWLGKLTETEEFIRNIINSADMPYYLLYSTGIEKGSINYQTETMSLSIPIDLRANRIWLNSVAQAVNEVYTGLNATKRKSEWGWANWPRQSLSNPNPFSSRYDLSVVFELLNEKNQVIGRQTVRMNPSFAFSQNNERIVSNYDVDTFNKVAFDAVKADDISDNLIIRIASVNGAAPENARFRITALPDSKWKEYLNIGNVFRISDGAILGSNQTFSRDGVTKNNLVLPGEIWEDPITSIAAKAFENSYLDSVVIPNSIKFIGERAFFGNPALTNITIGENVTVGEDAFSIYQTDGSGKRLSATTSVGFEVAYEFRKRRAGTYFHIFGPWGYKP